MTAFSRQPRLTRRDFLKLALSSGTAVTLLPVLEACNRPQTATPLDPTWTPANTATAAPPTSTVTPTTPAVAPDVLTAGLEDLDIDTFLDESIKRLFLRDPEGITIGG